MEPLIQKRPYAVQVVKYFVEVFVVILVNVQEIPVVALVRLYVGAVVVALINIVIQFLKLAKLARLVQVVILVKHVIRIQESV